MYEVHIQTCHKFLHECYLLSLLVKVRTQFYVYYPLKPHIRYAIPGIALKRDVLFCVSAFVHLFLSSKHQFLNSSEKKIMSKNKTKKTNPILHTCTLIISFHAKGFVQKYVGLLNSFYGPKLPNIIS